MLNRRQYYRHTFSPPATRLVGLTLEGRPTPLRGELLNLSLGGMAVQATMPPAQPVTPGRGTVAMELTPGAEPLTWPIEVVHVQEEHRPVLGLRFLPPADLVEHEEFQRRLWAFLLEEQRQARRRSWNG